MNRFWYLWVLVLVLCSAISFGALLDCDSSFCEGIKWAYSDEESKKIIAYEKVGFKQFEPDFQRVHDWNVGQKTFGQGVLRHLSPFGTIKNAWISNPLIDFSVKKGLDVFHQQKVASTALYGFDFKPLIDFDPSGDFLVVNQSRTAIKVPGSRDPRQALKGGNCKVVYDQKLQEIPSHYVNDQFVGVAKTLSYATLEDSIVHKVDLVLRNNIKEQTFVYKDSGCHKYECSQYVNNTCIRQICTQFRYDCIPYRTNYYSDIVSLSSNTSTIKPSYVYVEPILGFVEGETNKLFIEFVPGNLSFIRFDINGLYYQEDYQKYDLEISTEEYFQVTAQDKIRKIHTLRLVNELFENGTVRVEFDFRSQKIQVCKITTKDWAHNVYVYDCPDFWV